MARTLGILVLFALFLPLVNAATVETLSLTNCQLDASSYACSDTITASCNVSTTLSGTVITSTKFTISGYSLNGALSSGNTTSGVWSVFTPNDYRFADKTLTLDSVSASSSTGAFCSGTMDTTTIPSCYITFSLRNAVNTCQCQYVKTYGTITTANTQTVSIVPSAGCEDQSITAYTSFADYCDPQWVPQFGACTGTWNGTSYLNGQSLKTYYSANPSCCSLTSSAAGNVWYNHNTGSDCSPPIDSGTYASCTMSPYTQGGYDSEKSSEYIPASSVSYAFDTVNYKTFSLPVDQVNWSSLVWDFGRDGKSEIINFVNPDTGSNNGVVKLYSNQIVQLDSDGDFYTGFTGQPALVGLDRDQNGLYTYDNVTSVVDPFVLVPVKSQTNSVGSIVKYSVSGASLNFLGHVANASSTRGYGGLTCYDGECWTVDLNYAAGHNNYVVSITPDSIVTAISPPVNSVYVGASWVSINNQYPYEYSPVHVPKFSDNTGDEYLVYSAFNNQSCGVGYTCSRGVLMVYSAAGNLVGSVALVNYDADSQTSYRILRPTILVDEVNKKRVMFISAEESYYTGTNTVYQYQYYVVELPDSSSYFDAFSDKQFDVTPNVVWAGTIKQADEGVSPFTTDGTNAYFAVSARSAGFPVGPSASQFSPPSELSAISDGVFGGTTLTSKSLDVDPTGQNYLYKMVRFGMSPACSISFGFCVHVYDLNTGALVANQAFTGFSSTYPYSGGNIDLDPVSGNLYFSMFDSYPLNGYNGQWWGCFPDVVDNPTNVVGTSYCSGWGARFSDAIMGASYTGAPCPKGFSGFNCYANTAANSALVLLDPFTINNNRYFFEFASGSDLSSSPAFALTSLNSFFSGESLLYPVNVTFAGEPDWNYPGKVLYYDEDSDFLLTQKFYIGGLKKGLTTGYDYMIDGLEIQGSTISTTFAAVGNTFNFDLNDARYISTTGAKVRITDLGNYSYSQTSAVCGPGFAAMFYNSDRYILGVHYLVPKSYGGPVWAYCDFSNDALPVIYDYDYLVMPWLTSTSVNATHQQYTLDVFLAETTGRTDGTGDYKAIAVGYSTVLGTATDYATANGGSDGTVNSYSAVVWDIDDTHETASASSGSTTTVYKLDYQGTVKAQVSGTFNRKDKFVTSLDFDGDGTTDVLTHGGVFKFGSNTYERLVSGGNGLDAFAQVVDINSDRTPDIIGSGSTVAYSVLMSSPQAAAVQGGPLDVKALRCTQIPGTSNVVVQVATSIPDPDLLSIALDPGDGRGFISQSPIFYSGQYTVQYSKPGNYTLTAKAYSVDNPFVSDTMTCGVSVVGSSVLLADTDCSLGSDGEFQFTDSITRHGWSAVANGKNVEPKPSSGSLYTWKGLQANYELSDCDYGTVVVEAKLIPSDGYIFLKDSSGSKVYGLNFVKGTVASSSLIKDETGVIVDNYVWDGKTYITVQVSIDRLNGKVYYFVDGDEIFSKDGSLDVSSVEIGGDGLWDYVRTTYSAGKLANVIDVKKSDLTGDAIYLASCDAEAIQAQSGIESRMSSPNVEKYCDSTKDQSCDMVELAGVVSHYPDCYKEAFNYCVRVAYPKEEQVASSSSVVAATTCSSVLTVGVGTGQVLVPTLSGTWNAVIKPNMWYMLLFVLIIVLIVPPIVMARRRY